MDGLPRIMTVSVSMDLDANLITINHEGMPGTMASWLLEEAAEQVAEMSTGPTIAVIGYDGSISEHVELAVDDEDVVDPDE